MGQKNKSGLGGRAWNVLRLALLWARKGGIFKRTFLVDLIRNHLNTLRANTQPYSIQCEEREFSFDETPLFHFKLHKTRSMRLKYLPHIPCINYPSVDFEEEDICREERGISFRRSEVDDDSASGEVCEARMSGEISHEDIEIDDKAEEFIAKFYEQMKLQRQVSYLQYKEMLSRGSS